MRKTTIQLVAVFAIVLAAASPASAFYWTLRTAPTLAPIPPVPGADPIPLPPDTPVPGGGPENPNPVPEPATAVVGAIGVLSLGLRRAVRKSLPR